VPRAGVVAVIGPNGSGKSTLFNVITGLVEAEEGSIRFYGDEIMGLADYQILEKGVARTFQNLRLFPNLTVLDNLRMGCSKQAGGEQETIGEVLEEFPRLKRLLDRAGGALSGGEQQLLAIARCLCGKPRLVLLDEPTEGIQPSIIDEIVETLLRLRDNLGLTMILVEQNLDFIAALSQRILIIQKGAITREVQPGDLHDSSLIGEFIGITT